jgi:hypothetical protein
MVLRSEMLRPDTPPLSVVRNQTMSVEIAGAVSRRSRFGASLPLLLGLFVYVEVIGGVGAVLHDPDIPMHIAVGRWILAHRAVPHHGIFSLTMADAPWVAHEWLGEVVLAGLFDRFGWAGLVVVTALCAAATLALLLRALLRTLTPVHAAIAALLGWGLAIPHVGARPHIFAWPILVAWVAALVAARCADRAPSPWLAPLMTLWANLHGGFMFGLVLALLLAGEAVLAGADRRARLDTARGWGIFCGLSVVAALINPFGVDGLLLPLKLTHMSYALGVLVEWQSPNFQYFQPLELAIMALIFAALSFGWRLPPTRLVMLLLLLHMALQHRRHGELLGLAAPLLLAPALAPQLAASRSRRAALPLDRGMAELAKSASVRAMVLAGVVLVGASAAMLRPGAAPDTLVPAAALAAVKAHHIEGPVLNEYNFGGYLIFSGIAPFVDGRAELYGDAFLKRYGEAILGTSDQLPALLSEYGVTWTLFARSSPAVVLLDQLPGWRRLYTDDIAVVHVRDEEAAR